MSEIIKIGNSNIGGEGVNTINARDLHGALGVGKDFTNWIKAQIERARLAENRDFVVFAQKGVNPNGGRPAMEYHLTLDAGKHVAMMSGTDKGFEVRDYFLECERQTKQPLDLSTMLPAAMRQLANTIEELGLAKKQRDEAIRTKALIGNNREATAMATASVAVRKQKQLENELGRGRDYKAAKAIPWVHELLIPSKGMWSMLGKKLVLLSAELGHRIERIENQEFGHVNAYHVDVIDLLRKRLDADWNMLGAYRAE